MENDPFATVSEDEWREYMGEVIGVDRSGLVPGVFAHGATYEAAVQMQTDKNNIRFGKGEFEVACAFLAVPTFAELEDLFTSPFAMIEPTEL